MSDPDRLLVPPGTRLVHLGPHKTGSTSVQTAAHARRDLLREHGVHYAGRSTRPRKAVWALGVPGGGYRTRQVSEAQWWRLVEEVRAAGEQRVLVSNEDLGRADAQQAARVVDGLGGPRVHVVVVARPIVGYLPSQWQQRVRGGERRRYDDWLRVVLDQGRETREGRNVWQAHDFTGLLDRWVAQVGPDRLTVIASDDRDRDLLPRTFEAMLGLPRRSLEVAGTSTNTGLTWAETELVRGIFDRYAQRGWPVERRRDLISRGVVQQLRRMPRQEGQRTTPPLPDWALDRVRALCEQRVAAIRSHGVRVVGDLEGQLVPEDCETASTLAPPDVPHAAAVAAVEALLERALDPAGEPPS